MSGRGRFVGFLQPTGVRAGWWVPVGVAGVGSGSFLENRPPFPEGVVAGFSGRAGWILRVLGGVRRGGAARRCWR